MRTNNKSTTKFLLKVASLHKLVAVLFFTSIALSFSTTIFADDGGGGVDPVDGQCKDPFRPVLIGPISLCGIKDQN